MTYDVLNIVDETFNDISTHKQYQIRERVYLGKGAYKGYPLFVVHEKFNIIASKIRENLTEEQFDKTGIMALAFKLLDTLRLIISINQFTPNSSEILKLVKLAHYEMDDIEKLYNSIIDERNKQDVQKIEENQKLELRNNLSDNLLQLMRLTKWEDYLTDDQNLENAAIWERYIRETIKNSMNINNVKALELLEKLSLKIITYAKQMISSLNFNLKMIYSISKLFTREKINIEIQKTGYIGKIININDVLDDIETGLYKHDLAWLASLYTSSVKDPEDDNQIDEFIINLFLNIRDSREEFLWKMTTIARLKGDNELEDLAIYYTTLASALLSLTNMLDKVGLSHISERIQDLREDEFYNLLDNLIDLYRIDDINNSQLISLIKKKIKEMQELSNTIIELYDVAMELFNIIQFTDEDAQLYSIDDLKNYINKY